MKLLVGTLFAGENELEECQAAIRNQDYKNYDLMLIENLPELEAHHKLYKTFIENADFVIMESTYGDRFHKDVLNRVEKLKQIIDEAMKKGGNLIIPAFAVERTQDLLYDLNELYVKGELDKSIDVYIDSPLAIAATEIFKNSTRLFDKETLDYLKKGFHPLEFPNLRYSHSQEESMQLNSINHSIIISASGMCEAGRIKHHLKHNLWREECTILFVGYQAEGTLGRRLLDGEKNVVIFGEEISVNARIEMIDGYSGHADYLGLLDWMKNFSQLPKRVFLVHGEEEALYALSDRITQQFIMDPIIPSREESFVLTAEREESREFNEAAEQHFRYLELVSILEDIKEGILDVSGMLLDEMRSGIDDRRIDAMGRKLRILQRDMADLLE